MAKVRQRHYSVGADLAETSLENLKNRHSLSDEIHSNLELAAEIRHQGDEMAAGFINNVTMEADLLALMHKLILKSV